MAVRKIPKNYLFVTGRHATDLSPEMVEFESILEKEHMMLLDLDPRVAGYEAQPVHVPLPGGSIYTPDLLVWFHHDVNGMAPPKELIEVKTQAFLERFADEYAVKFAAADQFALDRGWRFLKKTEKDIRTPRLANAKFLRRYLREVPDQEDIEGMLEHLRRQGGRGSSEGIVSTMAETSEERARWLPVLWHLIASKRVFADLDTPFGADVSIWLEA